MSKNKFKLTTEDVKKIMTSAVNASTPVGLGILQFQEKVYKPNDFDNYIDDDSKQFHLDYVDGRMVKLHGYKEKDCWWFGDTEPRSDYQSWCVKYPSYKELVESIL